MADPRYIGQMCEVADCGRLATAAVYDAIEDAEKATLDGPQYRILMPEDLHYFCSLHYEQQGE